MMLPQRMEMPSRGPNTPKRGSADITDAIIFKNNIGAVTGITDGVGGRAIDGGNETHDGSSSTYSNDRKSVKKDDVQKRVIPAVVSECALRASNKDGMCISGDILRKLIAITGAGKGATGKDVMEIAKKRSGCATQRCVLGKYAREIGPQLVDSVIKTCFKVTGPTDVSLLDHVSLEKIMSQFAARFRGSFYAYNFNMRDYAQMSFRHGRVIDAPDTLATVDIVGDVYNKGYRTAACVINSDVYEGPGKHWMALFVDMRSPSMTVEFFNSSGNGPAPEWVNWMIKTKNNLEDNASDGLPSSNRKEASSARHSVSMERVTNMRHQHSKTECGIYALFYIYARLCGVPLSYFRSTPVPDQLMFEFRQHLFTGERGVVWSSDGGKSDGTFDFDKYSQDVRISWTPIG